VAEALVVNASPLIFLHHVQSLDWLTRYLPRPVLIPQSVVDEVLVGDGGSDLVAQIRHQGGFEIVPDLPISSFVAAWDLGAGESQVLSHCQSNGQHQAVLDDRAARNCAHSLGIPVMGTVGMVLIARQRGWISAARPVLENLLAHGLYLAPQLAEAALKRVGE
jgi:predicted nucleic acid-binding protein